MKRLTIAACLLLVSLLGARPLLAADSPFTAEELQKIRSTIMTRNAPGAVKGLANPTLTLRVNDVNQAQPHDPFGWKAHIFMTATINGTDSEGVRQPRYKGNFSIVRYRSGRLGHLGSVDQPTGKGLVTRWSQLEAIVPKSIPHIQDLRVYRLIKQTGASVAPGTLLLDRTSTPGVVSATTPKDKFTIDVRKGKEFPRGTARVTKIDR